ncbi:MAG: SDR family oxidoreductase [Candidatus Hydrogenedentes bacterium]|nr:SDR family oxidoreductase [Candidatus Hydrogenedentota bacterium]
MEFSGKTAIITGAASGMGLLSGQRMAAEGANVVLTDVNEDGVKAAAADIRQSGGEAIGVRADVTDYEQIAHAVELTMKTYGRVDILLNNAGGAPSRVFGRPEGFKDRDIELLDWGIDVNLKGAVLFSRAVIGHMIEQKTGVIINMGSIEGVTGSGAVEYSAAKSGMIGLTKSLALYGAPYGVRACCVSPGPVLTRPAMANMKTLLGRAAEPGEICDFILYLCSDKAAFITGSHHLIDGGRSCGAP